MNAFLIVRLGSLGDIIHALPAAAALRDTFPNARIDWLVDSRHRDILDLVPIVDRRIVLETGRGSKLRRVLATVKQLRAGKYDAAIDLQGLMKSAVLARASGAKRVLGFGVWHLRERAARPFYTETHYSGGARHVIEKNLNLVRALGVTSSAISFPLAVPRSDAPAIARERLELMPDQPFVLLNPGAAWPNKRWRPERFGALAMSVHQQLRLRSLVLWGPGEEALARRVVDAASGVAALAPATTVGDVLALAREAAVMVSGDTGPIHLAAAVGTPIVGIYGPTDPARNGPWAASDVTMSQWSACACHYKRECRFGAPTRGLGARVMARLRRNAAAHWCLGDVTVDEMSAAVARRLQQVAR